MTKTARLLVFYAALPLFSVASAMAQSVPVLPPIPDGMATAVAPRMESCDSTTNCDVSSEQIKAFDKARGLYIRDAIAAPTYSVVFGQEGGDIAITFIPSPLGTRGRAVTYLFDSSGSEMKRSYINR